jgi:hypothetical protein
VKSAASLSLRPEGEGADVRVLFQHQSTSGTRVLSGTLVHIAAAALLLLVSRLVPEKVYDALIPQRLSEKLVWLVQSGPGGGGGGGNKSPDPPPRAQLKGRQEISVPAIAPPEPQPVEPEKITEPPVESQTVRRSRWREAHRSRLAPSWAPERTATREAQATAVLDKTRGLDSLESVANRIRSVTACCHLGFG